MMEELSTKIESLLFYNSEPIKIKKLAEILNYPVQQIEDGLKILEEKNQNRGIRLIRDKETVWLTTSPENSEVIKKIKKEEESRELSKAALETLAIVLYRGPIKKSEIDYIRGVNSQFSLRTLLIKGLIDKEVNKHDERSYVYKPTLEVLTHLGLSKINELPEYQEVNEDINNFMKDQKDKQEIND